MPDDNLTAISINTLVTKLIVEGDIGLGMIIPFVADLPGDGRIVLFCVHEEQKVVARLKPALIEYRIGGFANQRAAALLLMIAIAPTSDGIGNNLSELWLNLHHTEKLHGIGVLEGIANDLPVRFQFYDGRGKIIKTIAAPMHHEIRLLAKAAIAELKQLPSWMMEDFDALKQECSARHEIAHLWEPILSAKMALFNNLNKIDYQI